MYQPAANSFSMMALHTLGRRLMEWWLRGVTIVPPITIEEHLKDLKDDLEDLEHHDKEPCTKALVSPFESLTCAITIIIAIKSDKVQIVPDKAENMSWYGICRVTTMN
jgi:hypothetical protein